MAINYAKALQDMKKRRGSREDALKERAEIEALAEQERMKSAGIQTEWFKRLMERKTKTETNMSRPLIAPMKKAELSPEDEALVQKQHPYGGMMAVMSYPGAVVGHSIQNVARLSQLKNEIPFHPHIHASSLGAVLGAIGGAGLGALGTYAKRRDLRNRLEQDQTAPEEGAPKAAALIVPMKTAECSGEKCTAVLEIKTADFRRMGRRAGGLVGGLIGMPSGPLGVAAGATAGFVAGHHIGKKLDERKKKKDEKKESAALSHEMPGTLYATLTPSTAPKQTPAADIGPKKKAFVIEPFPTV